MRELKQLALLAPSLAAVLALTAYTDWLFTGRAPNPLFYALVPVAAVLGGSAAISALCRYFRRPAPFARILALVLLINLVLQAASVAEKAVYHYVWQYPAALFLAFNVVLDIGLMTWLLMKKAGLTLGMGIICSLAGFLCGLLAVGIFTALTGIVTPGS